MRLPSRLAASTLGDLLGALHRSRTTGLLELMEIPGSMAYGVAGRRHRVHLFCGLVAGVETTLSVKPLGQVLHTKGLLQPEALADLMRRIAAGDPRLAGEILVEEGLLRKPLVELGLRVQLRDKLDAVFVLQDADVRFHTARPLSESARRVGLLSTSEFLHGRPRARDRARSQPPPGGGRPFGQPERRVSPNRPWAWRSQSAATGETSSDADEDRFEGSARPHPGRSQGAARPITIEGPRGEALRTLGLSAEADEAAIRRAFRKLAVKLHPDRFATAPAEAREHTSALFAEVSAAYHLLVA
jgi:hypothetical protein